MAQDWVESARAKADSLEPGELQGAYLTMQMIGHYLCEKIERMEREQYISSLNTGWKHEHERTSNT